MCGKQSLPLKLPLSLNSSEYSQLYSLMISEGSTNTEFALHVPEKIFHSMFKNYISHIISEEYSNSISKKTYKGVLRSRALAITRKLIPIPDSIPNHIMKSKTYSKEYLKVAFEAEGSAILDYSNHKRYLQISRYVNITKECANTKFEQGKRVYRTEIIQKNPGIWKKYKVSLQPYLNKSKYYSRSILILSQNWY